MTVNNELGRMWKEAVMADMKLSQQLSGESEKQWDISQDSWPPSRE
jgi:hypothetical protein